MNHAKGKVGIKRDMSALSEEVVPLDVKPEPSLKVEASKEILKEQEKSWNDMSHLSLKRFQDEDPSLTAGAKRNRASLHYIAIAELDPSGRAICKLCGERIHPKGSLRMGLMLECHKGYRNLCTLHASPCFWQHPETRKLTSLDEIFIHPNVVETKDKEMIAKQFEEMIQASTSLEREALPNVLS